MSKVDELERAVSELTRDEFRVFRKWLEEYEEAAWDREFEEDVQAGRLDFLAEEAIEDLRLGRTRPL